MKVRLLAVMAVVVVGVMAGTSPAMAQKAKTGSSKSQWTKQHKDNVAFGGAIHTLRKQVDSTNSALGTITAASIVALTQLKDGLTAVAAATTNFEYGVVQLGTCSNAACDTFTPTAGDFAATPPVYPTGEASVVTADFASVPTGIMGASVAYRSVDVLGNNKTSTPYCRVTITQARGAAGGGFATSTPNAALGGAPAYEVVRGAIAPPTDAEKATMPLAMVSTDSQTKLITSSNSGNNTGGAGGFTTTAVGAGGLSVGVTLACLTVPKS